MYCSHFGLQRLPFNNTPDPAFYFSTPDHEEALATLQYATLERRGFVLVTGEIGAGKTLTARLFLRQIDARATTAVINNTSLDGRQLLAAICAEFGVDTPEQASSLELTHRLQAFLLDQFSRDRHVIVLLDEAQNLPDQSFEELRMLGNLEADDAKLLQVCILGQPELRNRFLRPNMKQLNQRLFRRFHLSTLSPEQTAAYIAHRLNVAGATGEIFTPEAITRIVSIAGGVPRVINRICDNALLTAYGQNRRVVDADIIDLLRERENLPPSSENTGTVAAVPTTITVPAGSADESGGALIVHVPSLRRTDEAIRQLTARCEQHDAVVQMLRNELTALDSRLSEAIQAATDRAATGELDALRAETRESLAAVYRRLEEEAETLRRLRKSAARMLGTAVTRQQASFDVLNNRLQAQEAQLLELNNVIAGIDERLRERFETLGVDLATRQEVETLRHDSEHHLRQLEQTAERQARDLGELAEQNAARARELEALRRQVEEQRERLREQARILAGRIESVRNELESVRQVAADHTPIDRLREEQAQAARDLLERLAEHQQRFDTLAETVGRQCDLISERLSQSETMEQRVAACDEQVAELRQSLETSAAEFGYALQRVEQHCDRVSVALESLSAQTASREELQNLQTLHDQAIAGLRERIDGTSEAHEHALASLNQRWHALADAVETLKANSTPPVELARVEAQLNTGLNELRERCEDLRESIQDVAAHAASPEQVERVHNELERELSDVRERLQQTDARAETDIRSVIERVDALTARIAALEQAATTQYRLELSPDVMIRLSDQIRAARDESEQLAGALEQAGTLRAELHEASAHIQETMNGWTEKADEVCRQSEQLINATRVAGEILGAMRKVHAAISARLNSEEWQNELRRGETLVTRMEAATSAARTVIAQLQTALSEFENCRADVDAWSRRQSRGEELAARLTRLVREAHVVGQQFDRALEARKRLLAGIARNAGSLAEALAAARIEDEAERPTPAHPSTASTTHRGRLLRQSAHARQPEPRVPRLQPQRLEVV